MIQNPAIRRQIIEAMGKRLLQEQSLRNKLKAAETLAKLGHEDAVPYLLTALENVADEALFAKITCYIQMIIEAQPEAPAATAPKYDLRHSTIGNLADIVKGDQQVTEE
ncbi:MAG: HEAT repeat domain-containing protein [Spirulinaceae cyanobacterium]